MANDQLNPGEELGPVVQASATSQDQSAQLNPGETLGEPVQAPRYHTPKSLSGEISDKGFLSGIGSWLRDDGSTVLKRADGQTLQSSDGGTTWGQYQPQEGDYQTKKGGPIVNLISAGQKPGTITHYNPIVPLPGEDFKDTMKRAVDAGKKITPEQLKEDEDQNLMEAPGTLASAVALGATGPVIYGGAKGVSVLKQAIVGGDSQVLGHPENLMTPEYKKAHPYWAGAAEMAGGLSSPENAAMMIGTGKLGSLPGPAAKIASRLISGGFGLTMISGAVKNVPELWDVMRGTGKYADMSDDDRESIAKNLMFHITTNAAMGATALEHGATGTTTPLTEYGEAADLIAAKVGRNIASIPGKTYGATVSSIGSMLGRTSDFDTAIKRSSKIPSKQVAAHMEKIANVRDDLQAILNGNQNIEDPKGFGDAINQHIQQMEAKLQKEAGATKGSDEPVVPNITQRLIDRLDKFFDDSKGLYGDEQDVSEAKKKILEGILQSRNGQHLLEPNLFEAENVRRRFSRQGKPQFATNATPTTDAFKAGSLEAASELRKAIDESYLARGVDQVQESRTKEANLIDIRDKLYDAQDKAEKMGEGSVFRSLMKKIGAPSSVIAIALGHPISGAAVGAAVLGDQIVQNINNPNVNINRALDIASRNQGAQTTVPTRVNTPIHGALASHFGELVGKSTYSELEGRFMAKLEAKTQRGIPLEPGEQKILDKLNEAKLQENQGQQKLRDDQKKNIPPVKSATLPEDHESPMDVTGSRNLHENMGTQEGLVHELAHKVVAADRGIDTVDGVRSHNHSENVEDDSLMSMPIDWSEFVNEDGTRNHAAIRARAADLAATFMAGGVANEMWHGIPMEENKGMGADLSALKKMFRAAGIPGEEISKMLDQGKADAQDVLSRPNTRELLEQHAQVREPGLTDKYHFSQDRLEQVAKDVQEGANGKTKRNATGITKDVHGRLGEDVPGGEKGGAGGDKTELRKAGEGNGEGKGGSVEKDNEPNPKLGKSNLVSERGKPFDEQKYPHTQDVRVDWPDTGDSIEDQVKGLNKGHAMARARENWPGATITAIEPSESPKLAAKEEPKDIVEKEGLKYKGELVKGSGVHMFEHPDHPGMTAALEGPFTGEEATAHMNSKLKQFGVEPKTNDTEPQEWFNPKLDYAKPEHKEEFHGKSFSEGRK
jgi:hypothetical protein